MKLTSLEDEIPIRGSTTKIPGNRIPEREDTEGIKEPEYGSGYGSQISTC